MPAPEASICWLNGPAAPILEAICDRPAAGVSSHISLAALRSATSVIVGPALEENVILRDSDCAVTLRCHGSRASLTEVAEMAAFLASDRGSGMTGTVANLTGGLIVD